MTAASVFLGRGGGSNVIAISTGTSRPVIGSNNGATWNNLGSNFLQSVRQGCFFQEAVAINGIAYIGDDFGDIYSTTNFRTFTKINIASIASNASRLYFTGGANLFQDPQYPLRLYAASYAFFGGDFNDAVGIWYSDDYGVNWSAAHSPIAISASTQFGNFVEIGNYWYSSLSVSGNSSIKLYRINKNNFSDTAQINNSGINNGCWLHVIGSRLFALNGSLSWTDLPLVNANAVSLPSGFSGFCMTQDVISGTTRQIITGRRSDTGRLAIIYSDNVPETTWTYATVPNISIDGFGVGYIKVIPLNKSEGFVCSYVDSSDSTPSGILYSADGITWTEVADASLTNYVNVMNNPLVV